MSTERLGAKPFRDIINPVPPCWSEISMGWYKSLLSEYEQAERELKSVQERLHEPNAYISFLMAENRKNDLQLRQAILRADHKLEQIQGVLDGERKNQHEFVCQTIRDIISD